MDRGIDESHAGVRRRWRVGIVVARPARETGLKEQPPIAEPGEVDPVAARGLIGGEGLRQGHEALKQHPQAEHRKVGHRVAVMDQFPVEQRGDRSEEHTSELQSLMRISYAVFCLKKKTNTKEQTRYR